MVMMLKTKHKKKNIKHNTKDTQNIKLSTLQKSLTNLIVNSFPDYPSWSLSTSPPPPSKNLRTLSL